MQSISHSLSFLGFFICPLQGSFGDLIEESSATSTSSMSLRLTNFFGLFGTNFLRDRSLTSSEENLVDSKGLGGLMPKRVKLINVDGC